MPPYLVRGTDPYVGCVIGEQAAWDTAVSTTVTVPLTMPGETFALQTEVLENTKEFTNTSGGREVVELGRQWIKGTITCTPRYNAPWFWKLVAHAMCHESLIVDFDHIGGAIAPANTGNTHSFQAGSVVGNGLTIRMWRAGPVVTTGYWATYVGCMISSMTWNQGPDQAIPEVTFEFIGKTLTTGTASSTIPTVGGSVLMGARDLMNTGASVKAGKVSNKTLNHRGFVLKVEKKLEMDPSFLNALATVSQPGFSDIRDVTVEINSLLEQDWAATNYPFDDYLNKRESKLDIIYTSGTMVVGTQPYAIRLELPSIYWETEDHGIKEMSSNPTKVTARAKVATLDATGGLTGRGSSDVAVLCTVKVADDGDADYNTVSL
jgi:hypothetical protein